MFVQDLPWSQRGSWKLRAYHNRDGICARLQIDVFEVSVTTPCDGELLLYVHTVRVMGFYPAETLTLNHANVAASISFFISDRACCDTNEPI